MSQAEIKLYSKIKQICEERKISIRQLELGSALTPRTISRWDENIPSIEKVVAVADYLNVSVDELLGRTASKQKNTATQSDGANIGQELIRDIPQMTEEEISALLLIAKQFLARNSTQDAQ